MTQLIAGARTRAYLTVLSWLGDGRLRHCDVARDRQGDVVAITFARDLGYIEHVQEIESGKQVRTDHAAALRGKDHALRMKIALVACALAILGVGMVAEDVLEKLFS
jgi:hypothetical protein